MIPVIDLKHRSDAAIRSNIADEIAKAASESGFVTLINALEPSAIDACFDAAQQFFALPADVKMTYACHAFNPFNSNTYRGFFPLIAGDPSQKEGFEFGQCRHPDPSFSEDIIWPSEGNFQDTLTRMHTSLSNLAMELLQMLCESMQLSDMTSDFEDGMSTFRIIHYPARLHSDINESGLQPYSTPDHTDSGFITLLFQDDTGGLEALATDGNWIDVPPRKDSIVMNLGDLLQHKSGGRLKATRHRVRAPHKSRISMPFFFEPRPDALVQNPDTHRSIRYADFLREKIQSFGEYSARTPAN